MRLLRWLWDVWVMMWLVIGLLVSITVVVLCITYLVMYWQEMNELQERIKNVYP